jgi:hypothetical protein
MYLRKGLSSRTDKERIELASELLHTAVTKSCRDEGMISLPLLTLLLEHGANPNHKKIWDEFLDDAEPRDRKDASTINAVIEEFLRFGAGVPTVPMDWYFAQSDVDTSHLKIMMKWTPKKKKGDIKHRSLFQRLSLRFKN